MKQQIELPAVHDALNRMKRANERGTGCHLTAEMVRQLGFSFVGQAWLVPDPRDVMGSDDDG